MRKQTKLVAVLSATALLAIGASAAAFATGWNNDSGEWQWLDKDGIAITNEWKKSGNDWFYLGDDGNMVTDEIVEVNGDYYYLNESGAMVSNTWVSRDNEDGGDAEYNWYYFGADGKAYRNSSNDGKITTSKIKTINGKKYTFDAEGKMLYGWLDANSLSVNEEDTAWENATYYFGDWTDGSAQSGWRQVSVTDGDEEKSYWFWMDSNGKITKDKKKNIEGQTYYFTEKGNMIDDFADASENIAANVEDKITATSNVVYVNGDGATRKNTWIWAIPSEDFIEEDYTSDEYSWFYAKSNGKFERDTIKKIKNGKSYAFDEYGRMLTGLVSANDKSNPVDGSYTDLNGDTYAQKDISGDIYYFSDSETDGSMKKGYQNVEFDDDTYQMYFNTTNGKALKGYSTKISRFVSNGIVLKANTEDNTLAGVHAYATGTSSKYAFDGGQYDGLKYGTTLQDLVNNENENYILINSSGAVVKSAMNRKDSDDLYYLTDDNGKILFISANRLTKTKTDKNNEKAYEYVDSDGKVTPYYYVAE